MNCVVEDQYVVNHCTFHSARTINTKIIDKIFVQSEVILQVVPLQTSKKNRQHNNGYYAHITYYS